MASPFLGGAADEPASCVCAALSAVDTEPGSAFVKSSEYMSGPSARPRVGLALLGEGSSAASCGKSSRYTPLASMERDSVSPQASRAATI